MSLERLERWPSDRVLAGCAVLRSSPIPTALPLGAGLAASLKFLLLAIVLGYWQVAGVALRRARPAILSEGTGRDERGS